MALLYSVIFDLAEKIQFYNSSAFFLSLAEVFKPQLIILQPKLPGSILSFKNPYSVLFEFYFYGGYLPVKPYRNY